MTPSLQLPGLVADTSLCRQRLGSAGTGEITTLLVPVIESQIGKVLPVDLCRARTLHSERDPSYGQVWLDAADTMASK